MTMLFIIPLEHCNVIQIDDYKFFPFSMKAMSMGWKVAPAFINPKGILTYMNVPQGVVKVVLSLSSGRREI
jgi:hypothetical protein